MSEFQTAFQAGEIAREVALQGLSLEEFAAKAEISDKTLTRANRGLRLHSRSFGKIAKALGRGAADIDGLVKSA